jgi:hypothetical protein
MRRTAMLALSAAVTLGLVGCMTRLNFDSTVALGSDASSHDITADPAPTEQKVKVAIKSTNGEAVDVSAFLAKDNPGENSEPKKDKLLYSKQKVTDDTFEVKVPAKESLTVRIAKRIKNATVQVKMTN